ncbi:DUF4167 domain-containing protein [Stappia sp. GBMRC 2046]|uniref:DUF4167 domain-containing protein n=1 Tax=Stappia sediminis TaxID=2692190 RepID=A0A7X3LU73_9HYPH|nr:DUF4167 domain-containing protein [Stappia sediminis]MXN65196.1 DUF4167 domain-containing protein [Stappia sediminis]
MRPGNQNKQRMRGRGRKGPNPLSRTYESNGPDVKIRGTALHVAEKYQQLARDAHAAGDRVMSENYNQHAEHYLRIVAAAQPQPQQSVHSRSDEAEDEADQASERRGDGREGSSSRPYMPLDAPQPFIDRSPGINTKGLREEGKNGAGDGSAPDKGDETGSPGDSAIAEGAGADDDGGENDAPKRRPRGTRGRGVRRTKPEAAAQDADATSTDNDDARSGLNGASGSAEEGGEEASAPQAEDDAPKKPRARRTPRARTKKSEPSETEESPAPTDA